MRDFYTDSFKMFESNILSWFCKSSEAMELLRDRNRVQVICETHNTVDYRVWADGYAHVSALKSLHCVKFADEYGKALTNWFAVPFSCAVYSDGTESRCFQDGNGQWMTENELNVKTDGWAHNSSLQTSISRT